MKNQILEWLIEHLLKEKEVTEQRNKTANHPLSKHDLISERIHSQMYTARTGGRFPFRNSDLFGLVQTYSFGPFPGEGWYKELPLWATKELIIEFFRNEPPDRSEIHFSRNENLESGVKSHP